MTPGRSCRIPSRRPAAVFLAATRPGAIGPAALLTAALLLFAGCGGGSDSGGFSRGKQFNIHVTPQQLTFSLVAVGTSEPREVTIENQGPEGPLVIEGLELSDETSGDFTFTAPSKLSLEAGESVVVVVTYTPSDNVADDGALLIHHNASGSGLVTVDLLALEQRPKLRFDPSPVAFGAVRGGNATTKQVRIQNVGADKAIVSGLTWDDDASDDFEITDEPDYPVEIAPDGDAFFTITYTPQDSSARGVITAHYTNPDGKSYDDTDSVTVTGDKVVPDISISPGAIDYGWVPLDTRLVRPVAIVNEGTDTLLVSPPVLEPAHAALALQDAFAEEVALEPGDSVGFSVVFEAAEAFALTTDPIAGLRIQSNDPDESNEIIPIFARIEAPVIRVTPEDVIDFGIVAQNFSTRRELTLFNAGHADLEVSAIELVDDQGALAGEFEMTADADFPPTTAAGGLGAIAPNDTVVVYFTFTNRGPDQGEVWARVTVHSNDDTNAAVTVNLRARRGGAPTCDVVLEPGVLDYGTVPHGATKDMTVRIRNIGSGNCGYNRVTIADCSTSIFPGFPASCTLGTSNDDFGVINVTQNSLPMFPTPDGIGPGMTADIRVRFEPPDRAPLLFEFDEYAGFLQVTMYNPYGPGGDANLFKVPPDPDSGGGLGTTAQPNLKGRSGISRVSVLPDHIDFGLVTLGCYSETKKVSVYNSGTAPLFVTAIEPDQGCSSEFVIDAPPIPPDGIEVTTASPLVIEVKYFAQNLGARECNLIIRSSDLAAPIISVPMTGEGTLDSHQIDVFDQVAGQEVDILFVVDDSGSMCEEQDRLRGNLQEFINHAQTWGNQYQIGVVSTCVQDEQVCHGAGQLKSNWYEAPDWERWVTNQTWAHFTSNVDLGCSGGSDSQEAGLEAAHMALSLPLSHRSSQPCGSNADCQAPDHCIPGLAVCGGFNGGFLRQDAALEIVMLSDEEDQSPATPDFYVDFFKSIKGFANENFLHVHSIVGDKDHGCGASSGNTSGTTADAGDRYVYVSEATGGIVESICNESFAAALSEIGAVAFGLKVQFFLSRSGDPATIIVAVNGVICTGGWVYDPPSNSVIFEEGGPCMPQEGQQITVEYDAICYTN